MPETILSAKQQAALELLRQPVSEGEFYLAGGTALALQLKHRRSIDFYFFTPKSFNSLTLRAQFLDADLLQEARGTLTVRFEGVLVSFFQYPYPLLEPTVISFPVPIAHVDDIAAMKLSSIVGRGSKRDFIDLFAIMQRIHSLEACIDLFNRKFRGIRVDSYHLMRSLVYFEDAEGEAMPEMLDHVDWKSVKEFFIQEVAKLAGKR